MKIRSLVNLHGKKFGQLLCVGEAPIRECGVIFWLCTCSCGKEKMIRQHDLRSGKVKSCGCGKGKWLHGLSRSDGRKNSLYAIWISMKQRCLNQRSQSFHHYGGRGIGICGEWLEYEEFHRWAIPSGYSEGLSIERIDNDGEYSPTNCKWITRGQQAYNKRNSSSLTHNEDTKTFGEWQNITGINRRTIQSRIENGWPVEKALAVKPKPKGGMHEPKN